MSFNADVIAEVEQLEDLEVQLRQFVLLHVDLEAREAVGKRQEIGLAEAADGQDAAGSRHRDLLGLQGLTAPVREPGDDGVDRMRAIESSRVDVDAKRTERREVGLSLRDLLVK
jgi:hypothetical protein